MDDEPVAYVLPESWRQVFAFDAANNVEPAGEVAQRIAAKFGFSALDPLTDAISHAIEDAYTKGEKRGRLMEQVGAHG